MTRLTFREKQVIRLIAQGKSGPEIALELGIGIETVKSHKKYARAKLGAASTANAVALAVINGTVTLADIDGSSSARQGTIQA